jgi:hypothetical protein
MPKPVPRTPGSTEDAIQWLPEGGRAHDYGGTNLNGGGWVRNSFVGCELAPAKAAGNRATANASGASTDCLHVCPIGDLSFPVTLASPSLLAAVELLDKAG